MILLLDASAGFELLTSSKDAAKLRHEVEEAELVLAPDLYVSEIANVCWKAVRSEEISLNEATAGLRLALSIVDVFKPSHPLALEALREASLSAHPVYDLIYLVLARREAATLLSVDSGMKSLAKKMGIDFVAL